MLRELHYDNVHSTKNIIREAITGGLDFQYLLGSDNGSRIQDSYFYMKVRATFGTPVFTAAGAVNGRISLNGSTEGIGDHFSVCSNPVGALINSASLSVNGTQTQMIETFSTHTLANKMMDSTLEQEMASGSPYIPDDKRTEYVPFEAGNAVNHVTLNGKRKSARIRNACVISSISNTANAASAGYNPFYTYADEYGRTIEMQLAFQFPFLQNETDKVDFFGNNKFVVNFQLNSNAKTDLFVGHQTTSLPTILSVEDFQWAVPNYRLESPARSLKLSIPYVATYSHRTTHNGALYTIPVPSNTHMVCVFFTPARSSVVGADAAARFTDSQNLDEGTMRIVPLAETTTQSVSQQIYISFNGHNYPKNRYQLVTALGLQTDTGDCRRAYDDYRRLSGAVQNGEQPLLSTLEQFMCSPCFAFSCRSSRNISDGTSVLTISTVSPPVARTADINIVCYYDRQLDVEYGEFGEVRDTQAYSVGR